MNCLDLGEVAGGNKYLKIISQNFLRAVDYVLIADTAK